MYDTTLIHVAKLPDFNTVVIDRQEANTQTFENVRAIVGISLE